MVAPMNILIVESKAKCKTLLKHLGKDEWRVLPTGGHVERLADDRQIHPPKEVRKAYWSNRPEELPKPPWFWTERGEAAMRAIKDEAAKSESVTFYLAADPDREGERIAWHLEHLLAEIGACHRVTFQEITKPAVLAAVAAPRKVNQALVDAALVRTFIDRVVGWRASKIAKRYTTTSSNSMGRVQTPTLGFVVERELEREAHVPVRYFEVSASTSVTDLRVRFHEKSDAAAWVDEKNRFSAHRTADASLAESAYQALVAAGRVQISDVARGEKSNRPSPPFSTDTLLQAAGSRWGWSPKKTAVLAGQLYEAGHLTYIRTDSTRLAPEAMEAGRAVIGETWGLEQVGSATRQEPAAGVQDAHEAIRPTHLALEGVPGAEPDVQKLYALVRARTLASLMVPSRRVTLSLTGRCEGLDRVLEGTVGWYAELGWRRAFEAADLDNKADTTPITLDTGTTLELAPGDAEHPNPELKEDQTKPPARYRPHTLVKVMKEQGIGRPSTYAKTVERLEERSYVTTDGGALVPTESGRNIWLEAAPLFCMPDQREVFQTEYTAAMEALLDDVAEGRREASAVWETMLDEFKSAHTAAQEASKAGPLVPRTRRKLQDYLEAAPELAKEVGDLDALSEQQGRERLDDLRTRDIVLLPSEKQQQYLDRLLEALDLTLQQAVELAGLVLASESPNRVEVSALIEHLSPLQAESRAPSAKQLRMIADLAKKTGLDEAGACGLVGAESYKGLAGGKGGTASGLIDALLARQKSKQSGPSG
jgi:DNA topoisomerase-1